MAKSSIVRYVPAALAWGLAAFVVFVTLCPLPLRPRLGDPQLERFGAYFVTAGAFVLAYPRRLWIVTLGAVAAAIVLELGQRLVPGRDAGVPDAVAKALGGLAGAGGVGLIVRRWRPAEQF